MKTLPASVRKKAANIRLLLMDVDGVLTDGRIILDDRGVESKHFHVRDGQGISLLKRRGIDVGFITGREFLESAEVHGNYYATSSTWIGRQVRSGTDVLLEIDWQGARQVKERFGHAVGIFILPPSIDALEARLHKRGQDSAQVIARRLLAAGSEMAHAPEFDYVIINEDFATALAQLAAIVTATRLRYGSQAARHHDLFAQLGIG